jgi:hypothetical protein
MNNNDELKGLSGWLILVGLGVVIAPVRMLIIYGPIYEPFLNEDIWEALTSVYSVAYHPLWAPLLIGELVYNLLILIASCYLIYLFFSKHYLFPRFYIALAAMSLVFIPLDAWLLTLVLPDQKLPDETITEFLRALVVALIWIPYMLLSERVKLTFVEKIPARAAVPATETAV